MKNKIIYIAEFSLPNMSAYAVHVLKMCDSFSNDNKVELRNYTLSKDSSKIVAHNDTILISVKKCIIKDTNKFLVLDFVSSKYRNF